MSVQSQGGGLMIYLLEDEEGIRNFVIYALGRSGIEAEGFGAPSELYAAMEEKLPRLLLLDRMLPEEDGISVLRKLRAREDTRKLPVIMLTAKGMEVDKVEGLDSGADDYITKPFGTMELISRVKALLRRTEDDISPLPTDTISIGGLCISREKHEVTANGERVSLTLKEYALLELLMKNKDRVFSRDTLLREVWGYDFSGESRTVDVHIRTLRAKLGDCGGIIRTIRGVGYKAGEE